MTASQLLSYSKCLVAALGGPSRWPRADFHVGAEGARALQTILQQNGNVSEAAQLLVGARSSQCRRRHIQCRRPSQHLNDVKRIWAAP